MWKEVFVYCHDCKPPTGKSHCPRVDRFVKIEKSIALQIWPIPNDATDWIIVQEKKYEHSGGVSDGHIAKNKKLNRVKFAKTNAMPSQLRKDNLADPTIPDAEVPL